MKFETVRTLKNKVFATKLVRVEVQGDHCAPLEKQLEDDFGPVIIETGNKFEALVYEDPTTGEVDFKIDEGDIPPAVTDKYPLKFAVDPQKQELKMNIEIKFECDAVKESPKKFDTMTLEPLKVAELKCKIFEETIKARITEGVEEWKKQQTTFESQVIPSLDVPLC